MPTQDDVDTLRGLAAQGIVKVRFSDGREVMYATPQQMLDAASQLQSLVTVTAAAARTTLSSFDRSE